jgi:hypothetical protein
VRRMRKTVLLLASVAVAMLLANLYGCGPQQNVGTKNNEGLSKEEEKKLNQRLQELEKKVGAQDKAQPELPEQQTEDDVRAAAEAYYQAVSDEDWSYTYNHLDSETQSHYTEEEWFAKNQWFADNGSVTFDILSVNLDNSAPEPIADVSVGLNYGDGTPSTRLTYFVYEDGSWKHRFSEEENNLYMADTSYDDFVAAQGGDSSASASASASASKKTSSASSSANSGANANDQKHVKVVISSDVPVDVSISDDKLRWLQQEEISGTKTYEHDIASNSGLTVSAMGSKMRGKVSITVYENGQLKTQDSSSDGYAQVIF